MSSRSLLQKNVTQLGHWFNARAALPLSIVSQKLGIFHNNQAFYRQKGGKAGKKNSNPYLGNDSQIEALVTNFSAPTTTTTTTSSATTLQQHASGKSLFRNDRFMLDEMVDHEKRKKTTWVFVFQKYGKF